MKHDDYSEYLFWAQEIRETREQAKARRRRRNRLIGCALLLACLLALVLAARAESEEIHSVEEIVDNQIELVNYIIPEVNDRVEEPDEQVETVEPETVYTEEELEQMALVIYQEAGGDACSDETRVMVGNVVLNRVADDRFPDTIDGVLLQERQYGRLHWTGLVWPERSVKAEEAHAVERAYKCAEEVLSGTRLLPDDVIFQAEFVQGTEIVAHQDGFYFCR